MIIYFGFLSALYIYDFVGAVSEFKRRYENPILRGRDSEATDDQKKKGEEKLSEVAINGLSDSVSFPDSTLLKSIFCLLEVANFRWARLAFD